MVTNPDILADAIKVIFNLPPSDIKRISENLATHYDSIEKNLVESSVPKSRPQYNFPSYMSVTHTEWVVTEFLMALFNNYKEEYYIANENDATHDSSINITNDFNNIDEKIGQVPRIVVEVPQSVASQQYLANLGAKTTDFIPGDSFNIIKKNKSFLLTMPITISVISELKNEANVLACVIQMALATNMPILRKELIINHITFPSVSSAKPLKDHGKLFMASVQFSIDRYVYWSELFTEKAYENLILRLRAGSMVDDKNPITQIIAKFNLPLDPNVAKMLKALEEEIK